MRKNFKECNVEECTPGQSWKKSVSPCYDSIIMLLTLHHPITNVIGKTGRQSHHSYPQSNTDRTGEAEDDVGDDEGPEAEGGLGNVESQGEGHDSLVDDDSNEDTKKFPGVLLQTNGQPLEDRVEREGEEQHDAPEGGLLEDRVREVGVAVASLTSLTSLASLVILLRLRMTGGLVGLRFSVS